MGFVKPPHSTPTPHLFVANCGPALALPLSTIHDFFASFGPVASVQEADNSGCRVIVSFHDVAHAQVARMALDGLPCSSLRNRILHIQYSMVQLSSQVKKSSHVCMAASETGIPGIFLLENFVSEVEEQELLAAVDEMPWQILSKRRVQHYGYEFQYKIRNVDINKRLGELPHFTHPVVERISTLSEVAEAEENSLPLDQLTINEYSAGVGLSPHIDTHSAFEGAIISLSLAGPCVMEFRRYEAELDTSVCEGQHQKGCKNELKGISRSRAGSFLVEGLSSDEQHKLRLGDSKQRSLFQCRLTLFVERRFKGTGGECPLRFARSVMVIVDADMKASVILNKPQHYALSLTESMIFKIQE